MNSKAITAPSTFADNVSQLLTKIEYRRVETEADLDAVERLRYAAYLKEGAIAENETERLADDYDALANAVNIGVFLEDRLVAAKRFHFLSNPDDVSPSYAAFSEVLRPQLEAGKRIIDPNRFVVDYETARAYPHLAYATLRLSVIASAYYAAHLTTVAVRPEHRAFYQRAFFAVQAAPPRHYPGLVKKLCLMLVNYEKDQDRIYARGPFYASTPAEQERLFGKIPRKDSARPAVAA